MRPTAPALSVVLPAFNEELNIERAVRTSAEAVAPLVPEFEIVAVDDGSRDRTRSILEGLGRRWENGSGS